MTATDTTYKAPAKKTPKQKRSNRPLAALNREYLNGLRECPSKSIHLQSPGGRTTQSRFLKDILKVMSVLVDQMCLRTRKVGTTTQSGFFLFTWARVAELAHLPEWRVKQCVPFLRSRGWITSEQPWATRDGSNGKDKYVALTSIKKVTLKYFRDLGLTQAFKRAHRASAKSIRKRAKQLKRPIRTILTPITLLRERRKHAQQSVNESDGSPPLDPELAEFDAFMAQSPYA